MPENANGMVTLSRSAQNDKMPLTGAAPVQFDTEDIAAKWLGGSVMKDQHYTCTLMHRSGRTKSIHAGRQWAHHSLQRVAKGHRY